MMWVLLTLVFVLMRVAPGDPISAALGGRVTSRYSSGSGRRSGSTSRSIVQYWDYLSSVLRLDFGTTFTDNQPVLHVVRDNGGATLSLTMAAFVVRARGRYSHWACWLVGRGTGCPTS